MNLNVYRNLHYMGLNKAKKEMKLHIKAKGIFSGEMPDPPFQFVYTIYRKDKRKVDLMNIGSVIDKFVSDALVELGWMEDDNITILKMITVLDGGIDRHNPRAKLHIKRFSEDSLYHTMDKQLELKF